MSRTRPIRLWVVSTTSQSRGLRRTRPRYSSSRWPKPHARNQNTGRQQHITESGPPPRQPDPSPCQAEADQCQACAQTGSLGESVSVTAFSGNPNSKGIIANRQAHPPSTIASDTSRPESKGNGANARLRPCSQTQPNETSSERIWKLPRMRCRSHNTALPPHASGERRPEFCPQRQSSDLLSLIAERLITCSGGSRNEAMKPQNTSLVCRGKSRQCMPQPRDCTTWLRAGDTTVPRMPQRSLPSSYHQGRRSAVQT